MAYQRSSTWEGGLARGDLARTLRTPESAGGVGRLSQPAGSSVRQLSKDTAARDCETQAESARQIEEAIRRITPELSGGHLWRPLE